jgi:uncharacterized protein YdhG (YjbR/CyaY superfamily)
VHMVVPEIEEAIKWGHPAYTKQGKLLLGTAAFKGTCGGAFLARSGTWL